MQLVIANRPYTVKEDRNLGTLTIKGQFFNIAGRLLPLLIENLNKQLSIRYGGPYPIFISSGPSTRIKIDGDELVVNFDSWIVCHMLIDRSRDELKTWLPAIVIEQEAADRFRRHQLVEMIGIDDRASYAHDMGQINERYQEVALAKLQSWIASSPYGKYYPASYQYLSAPHFQRVVARQLKQSPELVTDDDISYLQERLSIIQIEVDNLETASQATD